MIRLHLSRDLNEMSGPCGWVSKGRAFQDRGKRKSLKWEHAWQLEKQPRSQYG